MTRDTCDEPHLGRDGFPEQHQNIVTLLQADAGARCPVRCGASIQQAGDNYRLVYDTIDNIRVDIYVSVNIRTSHLFSSTS